jgi:hypothetical protein
MWDGYNKVGYLTAFDIVVYPRGRRLARRPLAELMRRRKVSRQRIDFPADLRNLNNIEVFFTQNADNSVLFNQGVFNLLRGADGLDYFALPIKLPRLEAIDRQEHECRWQKLLSVIRPTDLVCSIDTQSAVSRLIARVDHGPWSHTFGYLGNGRISEATPPRVREAHIDIYRPTRYRLGLYRVSGTPTDEQTEKLRQLHNAQLGKPYAYRKVLQVALWKILRWGPHPNPLWGSPNDICMRPDLNLIHVV